MIITKHAHQYHPSPNKDIPTCAKIYFSGINVPLFLSNYSALQSRRYICAAQIYSLLKLLKKSRTNVTHIEIFLFL